MGLSKRVGPVLLTAVLVSGCGGGEAEPAATVTVTETAEPQAAPTAEAPTAEAETPVIAEQATHVENPFGDTFQVFYTVVITNPNEDLYGSFPTFAITARDAAGGVLGTQDQVLSGLPPGGRVAFGSLIEASSEPASVDITFKTVDWAATETAPSDYPVFAATPRLAETTYGGWTVSGDVQNPFAAPIDSLSVTALLRNDAGQLLGGSTNYVSALPASGSLPFEVTTPGSGPLADATSAEVVSMPWGGLPEEWEQLVTG